MSNRTGFRVLLLCGALFGAVVPASAQQTLNFSFGYFAPKGEDARVRGDVLNANRNFLVFDVRDFGGASVGAEWLVPLGQYLEAGAGLGFSRRTVASVYEDFVDNDGTEIDQNLRLRIVPVAFTVRVLPLGQANALQPYLGAGLGLFNWRYSETGEFVDFGAGRAVFRDRYVADGSQRGAVVLGGLRFGGEGLSAGGEVRFHSAEAALDDRFAGSTIDLGGWTYQFTMGIRFR